MKNMLVAPPVTTLLIAKTQVFICRASVVGTEQEDLDDCDKSKHCDSTETILRVKDPLAAVWPFCGIVVEVLSTLVVGFDFFTYFRWFFSV